MAENEVSLKQQSPEGFDLHIKLVNGRELIVASKNKKVKTSLFRRYYFTKREQ